MLSYVPETPSLSPLTPTPNFAWRNATNCEYLFKDDSHQEAYPDFSLPILPFIIWTYRTPFLLQPHTFYNILLIVDACLNICFNGQKGSCLKTEAESVIFTRASPVSKVLPDFQ